MKTMEIYLQEVLYVTYVERLPADTKSFIATAAAGFQDVLQKAKFFHQGRYSYICLVLPAERTTGCNGG